MTSLSVCREKEGPWLIVDSYRVSAASRHREEQDIRGIHLGW